MSGTIAAYRRVIGNGRLARARGAHLTAETAGWTYLVALFIVYGRLLVLEGREFLELVGAAPGLGSRLADLHRGATGR